MEREPNPDTIRQEARHQAAQHLWRLLYESGCSPDDWNGGDVVPVVEQWLIDQGVDTSAEPARERRLTEAQEKSLRAICDRYTVEYNEDHYHHTFDLPEGYVAGFVGGAEIQAEHPTIYVGAAPDGRLSS